MNFASFSIQASPARIAWLESSLDWTVLWNIYSASLIVNICMFYLFINKGFIHYITPDGCHIPKYNSVCMNTEFDLVSLIQSGFE